MGKTKRPRQKFHLSVSSENTAKSEMDTETNPENFHTSPENFHTSPLFRFEDDIFKGIDINIDSLTTNVVEDDRRSVKSFKSLKSELSGNNNKILPKKHKLKLRRELFLKKMGNVYQMKEKNQLTQKKKESTLPQKFSLLDALPSLQSLLHTSDATKEKPVAQSAKLKGVQKAKKRKKEMAKEVGIYKKVLSNEKFKTNSMAAIAEHIKAVSQKN